MEWLFIIGICLDVAGAMLAVGGLLLLGRGQIRTYGALFPSGGPHLGSMRELTFAWTGVSLLVLGFVLQLAGHIWESGGGRWFIAAALPVIFWSVARSQSG